MSQHDGVIPNLTGAPVRTQLNLAFAAVLSNNSGATAPATTYAHMTWGDTANDLIKIRNATNTAWISGSKLSDLAHFGAATLTAGAISASSNLTVRKANERGLLSLLEATGLYGADFGLDPGTGDFVQRRVVNGVATDVLTIARATGAAAFAGALSATGTLTVGGNISNSVLGGSVNTFLGSAAAQSVAQFNSDGNGGLWVGKERSVGGAIMTGSTGYAGVIVTTTTAPIEVGINDTKVATFSVGGLAVTGTLSATGAPIYSVGGSADSTLNGHGLWINNTGWGSSGGLCKIVSNNGTQGLRFVLNTAAAGDFSTSTHLGTLDATALAIPAGLNSSSATAGVGYSTGAGGTVTQATSKSTGVTLNKVCGAITLDAAALADATTVTFAVTNSALAATDVPTAIHKSGGTPGAYLAWAHSPAAGSFSISVRNVSGGSLSEAIVIGFSLGKAVTA